MELLGILGIFFLSNILVSVVQVSMPENNCQNFGTVMMKQVDQKKIYLNLMVCTLIIVVVGSHALKPLGSFDVMLFAFIDFHSWLSRNYL